MPPLPGLSVVKDLASARDAIETIVEQGEGAPQHSEDSHYARFLAVKAQLEEMVAKDPTFQPAWPVARNPCAKAPIPGSNRIQITDPEAA
jgi:hypothetical protein